MGLADAGPLYGPVLARSRVDFLPGTHLPKRALGLAGAVDVAMRECYLACFGTGLLDSEGQSGSRYQYGPSLARGLFKARRSDSAGAVSEWPSDERLP